MYIYNIQDLLFLVPIINMSEVRLIEGGLDAMDLWSARK